MRLLPLADALGILSIPKVILVFGLGQPRLLTVAFAGPAAIGFGTKALPLSITGFRKKKFLAVQALAQARGGFHRFQNPGNQNPTTEPIERKKIPIEEDSNQRRRKNSFQ